MFIEPRKILNGLNLKGNEIIIDFGAGSGAYSLAAAEILHKNTGQVYSIDIQANILKSLSHTAKDHKYNNMHFILADIENIGGSKLYDSQADVVIISNLMHSLVRKTDALLEAMRLLKEDGSILVIDWKNSYKSMGPQNDNVFSRNDCINLCDSVGLSPIKEFEAGSHHFALLFKKSVN